MYYLKWLQWLKFKKRNPPVKEINEQKYKIKKENVTFIS